MFNALSVIVTNFGSLSSYAAVVRRLGAFTEALDAAGNEGENMKDSVQHVVAEHLAFENVTIVTPNRSRVVGKRFKSEARTGWPAHSRCQWQWEKFFIARGRRLMERRERDYSSARTGTMCVCAAAAVFTDRHIAPPTVI